MREVQWMLYLLIKFFFSKSSGFFIIIWVLQCDKSLPSLFILINSCEIVTKSYLEEIKAKFSQFAFMYCSGQARLTTKTTKDWVAEIIEMCCSSGGYKCWIQILISLNLGENSLLGLQKSAVSICLHLAFLFPGVRGEHVHVGEQKELSSVSFPKNTN